MLSRNDFELKQILFINTLESNKSFKFSNDMIVICTDDKITQKISLHKIFAVYIVGSFTITSNLIDKCQQFGISLFLLKNNFDCYASIESFASGNFLLRYQQYHLSERREFEIAKLLITNKTDNQLRLIKKQTTTAEYKHIKSKFTHLLTTVDNCQSLLGVEGSNAKVYFGIIFEKHNWYGRSPRSKPDIPNLLLDIGYTYLYNFVDCMLRLYGFDTYKGVYHKLFFNRKSLSCDIMEPFRVAIDYALIKAYNLNQVDSKDFKFKNGSYQLPWNNAQKYSQIFMSEIMHYKLEIYDHIKAYYRYCMNPSDNPFPKFDIKVR